MITVFDAPGAGTGPGQGTFPFNSPQLINPNGAITGFYTDSADALHSFVRDDNGVITTFDAPGAGTGAGQGTQSFAISPNGKITGFYFDGTDAVHGFLRDKKGVITTFDRSFPHREIRLHFDGNIRDENTRANSFERAVDCGQMTPASLAN